MPLCVILLYLLALAALMFTRGGLYCEWRFVPLALVRFAELRWSLSSLPLFTDLKKDGFSPCEDDCAAGLPTASSIETVEPISAFVFADVFE